MFPEKSVYELRSPQLKKLAQFFSERVVVLLQPSLYRAVKLTYLMEVDGIVLNGNFRSELGIRSLVLSVAVLTAADFRPICD